MSSQALARQWRPRKFSEVIGQDHVVKALVHALDSQRLHHAYLFSGTRGVGKTTIARIFAKALNCERGVSAEPCCECSACLAVDQGRYVDLIEVDAASRTKVDDTRDLLDNVQYAPAAGRYKVYLVDEVHMLSTHSFNALLKTLEEPPSHVIFLFATTDPKKLPVTVLSRCLQFNLRAMSEEQIERQLQSITESESVSAEPLAMSLIAAAAHGSMRDALSLLDQAIAYSAGELSEDSMRQMLGIVDDVHIRNLLEALSAGDANALLDQTGEMARASVDFEVALDDMLYILYQLAMLRETGNYPVASRFDREWLQSLAERITPEDIQLYYQIGINGKKDLPYAPFPRTGFEMIMLRMLAFRPGAGPELGKEPVPAPKRSAKQAVAQAEPKAQPQPQSRQETPAAPTSVVKDTADSGAKTARLDWHEAVGRMKLGGLIREAAVNAELESFEEGKLSLRLDPRYQTMLNRMRQQNLEECIAEYYGEPVRLEVVFGKPRGETPRDRELREQAEAQTALVESVKAHPLVKDVQERFGATLDEASIERTN